MTFALILLISFWYGDAQPASWHCSNKIEIRCDAENCKAERKGEFTPMRVTFDEKGAMTVCAYSGCWEGTGQVFESGDFLVLTGNDLYFSTAKESESAKEDIVIALDKKDDVAILKAGSFSHPIVCKQKMN